MLYIITCYTLPPPPFLFVITKILPINILLVVGQNFSVIIPLGEMSCDERVLKEMGTETKKDYALSLLSLAANRRIIGGSPLAFSEGGLKQRMKNVMNFKKPSKVIIMLAVAFAAILSLGVAVNRAGDKADFGIPEIVATETINGAQVKLLRFGYSWYDGKNGTVADAVATWQGEYTEEYTLIIDGEIGQNMIALSAENPVTVRYAIYLPDGRLYDSGARSVYDSLSSRLYKSGDKSGIGVIAPFEPGEYIYEVTLGWIKEDLRVTSTYGFKLIMTGKRSAYDEALDMVWDYHNDALTASFKGVETLPGAEDAGDCYVFEVELPEGIQPAAVSKEHGIFFTYSDGIWLRAQDLPKLKQPVLLYIRDAVSTQHEAFYAVVLKLYEMDSGLNGGIKYIAIDMAGVFESEREALQADLLTWVNSLDCELLIGSYSDLAESGYITPLPQKGEQIDVNTNYGFNKKPWDARG